MKKTVLSLLLSIVVLAGCGGNTDINTDRGNSTDSQNTSAVQTGISEEKAKEIALARVEGATKDSIREFGRERELGADEYEGKIVYNGTEYEFEINAQNGEILKWESEPVND